MQELIALDFSGPYICSTCYWWGLSPVPLFKEAGAFLKEKQDLEALCDEDSCGRCHFMNWNKSYLPLFYILKYGK